VIEDSGLGKSLICLPDYCSYVINLLAKYVMPMTEI
jgi:hypothetical protein